MRWLAAFFILLTSLLSVSAEDWTTSDGKIYKDVAVIQVADDGVTITYTGGTAKLPYYNLPLDIQKQYGHDPETLEANRKALDDAADSTKVAAEETKKHLEEQQKELEIEKAQVKALADARASIRSKSDAPQSRPNQVGDKASYPGAELSYDHVSDVSHLDSPAAAVLPLLAPSTAKGERTAFLFRVETFGTRPQKPEKLIATILSVNAISKLTGSRDILFLVDKVGIAIPDTEIKEGGYWDGAGQVVEYISFYVTPEQADIIAKGKNVRFSVGDYNYALDPASLPKFQRYLAVVNQLEVPPPMLVQQYQHITNTLPSIPMMISKVCEYIVVGSFSILVLLGLAGCFLAAARFLKL